MYPEETGTPTSTGIMFLATMMLAMMAAQSRVADARIMEQRRETDARIAEQKKESEIQLAQQQWEADVRMEVLLRQIRKGKTPLLLHISRDDKVETYLHSFEIHMAREEVELSSWTNHLHLLLTSHFLEAFKDAESKSPGNYAAVK